MIDLPVCRWREYRDDRAMYCRSGKYVGPPNRVDPDFCLSCRDHEPAAAPVAFSDDLLPAYGLTSPDTRLSGDLPPMFCITCRQTPERTAQAVAHFRERDLKVHFFPGIHGKTFGLRTVLHAGHDYRMPAGHVGLVLSHYMLWQTLAYLPFDEVLILEDDAWFDEDFPERFRQARAELPADWQFVFVGSVATGGKPVRWVSPRVGVLYYPCGTHAYLVRRSVLPFLLRTNHQARSHIDLQLIENSLPYLRFYVFLPSLVRQHSCDGNWPTTTAVADAAVVSPSGCWIGTERYGHHFDASLATALADLFIGGSVADLGCGDGSYVRALSDRGVDCDGFDGNPDTPLFRPGCRVLDLSGPASLPRLYDWVLSLEVGEHIPAAHEEAFIDNLHRHNRKGIVLSWAVPGQGGHGHCNERDNGHVRARLRRLGYRTDAATEERLRAASRLPWFNNTLMVFVRETALGGALHPSRAVFG